MKRDIKGSDTRKFDTGINSFHTEMGLEERRSERNGESC